MFATDICPRTRLLTPAGNVWGYFLCPHSAFDALRERLGPLFVPALGCCAGSNLWFSVLPIKNDGCLLAAIVFIGRTRTEGSNRRSSRVQGELAHIAEAPGGKAAAGGLVLPPLLLKNAN